MEEHTPGVAPSVAKIFLPLILSNLHKLGTKRDTTKELEMSSKDIYLLYQSISWNAYLSYLLPFSSKGGLKHMRWSNTFAIDSTCEGPLTGWVIELLNY